MLVPDDWLLRHSLPHSPVLLTLLVLRRAGIR
jgi:hypothetical protein